MSILKKFISDKSKVVKASILTGGLAVIVAASIVATTAYLSATTNPKENTFQPYTLTDTQISEPNGTTYTVTGNYVTNKEVVVQNPAGTDKKPVFVRVLATVESNETVGDYGTFTSATIAYTQNLNTAYWCYSDGYYYYKYVLYPGYQTQPLFTDGTIYFNGLVEDKDITLTFTTDTVQAWANGTRDVINTSFVTNAWGDLPTDVITDNTSSSNDSIS